MKPGDIVSYWYSDKVRKQWFSSTPELDAEILGKFEQIWVDAAQGNLIAWRSTPLGSLALVLIFDQFPLNMFRGEAKSFQTESDAIMVAREAINNNFDTQLSKQQLAFLFMPFMHSEQLEDQDMAVELFRQNDLKSNLKFAEHHRVIVKKFGRFPHRNGILGRESTKEEQEYLQSKGAFKG